MNNLLHTPQALPQTCWLSLAPAAQPDPEELEYVRNRFSKQFLMAAPMPAVENTLWGIAAEDARYLEEVPVVVEEVKAARSNPLTVVR